MTIKKTSRIIITVIVIAIFLVFIIYSNLNVLIINQEAQKIQTVKKILTTGEWRMGDSVLNFTGVEYTVVNISSLDGQEEKTTCKYELVDAILEDEVYKIHWIKTDNDENSSDIMEMEIAVIGPKGNNFYLYSSSLPFTSVYTKNFDIVFIYPHRTLAEGIPNEKKNLFCPSSYHHYLFKLAVLFQFGKI